MLLIRCVGYFKTCPQSKFICIVIIWSISLQLSAQEVIIDKNVHQNITWSSGLQTSPMATVVPTVSSTPASGTWLNKGSLYDKCPNIKDRHAHECNKLLQGKSLNEAPVRWMPDYTQIVRKIVCTLETLNCPSEKQSFQLHDIPCQSTCLAALVACGGHVTGITGYPNTGPQWYLADSCPSLINSRSHLSRLTIPTLSRLDPYPQSYLPNEYFHGQSRDQYMHDGVIDTGIPILPPPRIYNGNPILRRYPRNIYPPQTWDYYRGVGNNRYIFNWNMLGVNRARRQKFRRGLQENIDLTEDDCYLLPAGGCDLSSIYLGDMMHSPTSMHLKVNTGCPSNTLEICKAMFPHEFTRKQWAKGGYTVVAIIKISQVLWWFGKNDRFQPFIRFHVVETTQTDIHPYDDKIILTYPWPTPCMCPEEMTVGKTYLMLTHSFKDRQTLNVTSDTVFLSRVKRFSKRLACWRGICPRRRNRRRRVPNPYWRFNS